MKFYFVPQAHLSSLQVPTHSVLPTISQGGHCCHPYFTDKETNSLAQSHKVTQPVMIVGVELSCFPNQNGKETNHSSFLNVLRITVEDGSSIGWGSGQCREISAQQHLSMTFSSKVSAQGRYSVTVIASLPLSSFSAQPCLGASTFSCIPQKFTSLTK